MEPSTLTTQENLELEQYEAIIEHGLRTFVDVGNALLKIREGRLYRDKCKTFEEYCQGQWGFERRQAYRLMDAAQAVENVSHGTQIEPTSERQARPLTRLEPEQQQEAWAQVVEENPDGKITGAKVQAVVDKIHPTIQATKEELDAIDKMSFEKLEELETETEKPKPHVTHNSGNNEWYTPAEYIEAARRVMGTIDLDPASSDKANETVKADTYYTAEIDGLVQEWAGRVWMNPPYASTLIGPFCEKLIEQISIGNVPEACVLVNNATETGWFNTLLKVTSAICLVRGRIKYLNSEGKPDKTPLQGQIVLYIGPHDVKFAEQFDSLGRIFHAW